MLQVQGLTCGYFKQEIVHGVDFAVNRSEFVCIIGANGCGKTTILKTILGILKPYAGSVTINGKQTTSLSEKELAKHFAYIPQVHSPPFPFTVADVVILGRTPYINRLSIVSDEDRQVAWESLVLLGIEDLAERVYTKLSGGQQQLVLIARALTQQPDLLIMDEPTASLDFGNQQTVLSRMRTLANSGTSVLMVTHDPDHAFFCADRVLVMHEGVLIAQGRPQEVMTTECLQHIYNAKVRVIEIEIEPGRIESVCVPLKQG
jgi:iron complex transport system ATP-binding protein